MAAAPDLLTHYGTAVVFAWAFAVQAGVPAPADPTGSGREMNLYEVAREIAQRLASIFLRDEAGRRPVNGGARKFNEDPHWRDLVLFYEYFHGDNGAGIGASHQTGWTGTVARLIQLFGSISAEQLLDVGLRPFMSVFSQHDPIIKAS